MVQAMRVNQLATLYALRSMKAHAVNERLLLANQTELNSLISEPRIIFIHRVVASVDSADTHGFDLLASVDVNLCHNAPCFPYGAVQVKLMQPCCFSDHCAQNSRTRGTDPGCVRDVDSGHAVSDCFAVGPRPNSSE